MMKLQNRYKTMEDKISPPYIHFSSLFLKKEKLLNDIEKMKNSIVVMPNLVLNCAKELICSLFEEEYICPIFFKLSKSKEIKLVKDYIDIHLKNTLIKELFIVTDKDLKYMTSWVVHQLYYYRIFRCESFEEVSVFVLNDLADIIEVILNKELTIYKEFDTATAINFLRRAYNVEKIIKMGNYYPTHINFRKKSK